MSFKRMDKLGYIAFSWDIQHLAKKKKKRMKCLYMQHHELQSNYAEWKKPNKKNTYQKIIFV